jgi:ankyrin repeat protein
MLTDVERGFPLVNAAESGNLEAVNMLLEAGSRVNVYVKNYFGTPLQAAVHAEQYDMVKFLIEEGADVNAPYGEQYKQACWRWPNSDHLHDMIQKSYQCIAKTPIQIACQINNIPLFELLLGHGALVNLSPLSHITAEKCIKNAMFDTLGDYNSPGYKTIPYHTALQYSVYNRNLFLVRRLLSLDITRPNPDSRVISNWGDTPLQMAARLNYPEIVSVLIANGADVNAPPGWINGRTALQAAAESGNIEMVQLFLLRNADVNAPAGYERGLTALQAALRNGHPEIVELLLRSNADIHAPPSPHHGLSTIAAATSRGNLPMLKFLMENGSEEGDSMPAICAAANYGWVEGARYLLQQGSDANSIYDDLCEDYYDCPLLSSIMNGDLEMMELLLEFGVNFKLPVKPKSGAHEDALCMVLYERCPPEIILLLCHHYAKLGPDSLAEKTLALAVTYTYYKQDSTMILTPIQVIMSGLSEASYSERVARAWADLSHYIWDEHDELDEDQILLCFKFLLEMGADINMGVEFATVLQIAIWSGKMKLARYILEQGAEIQVPAAEFVGTPLQEAILKEELELAYTFLERGADVNALPSSKGGTALQAAAETGNINIAVELLRRGARVAADNGGGTAINTAAVFGREDMLQLLLNHYDGDEDLWHVCLEAAHDAEVIGHLEIAEWLRGYAVPRYGDELHEKNPNNQSPILTKLLVYKNWTIMICLFSNPNHLFSICFDNR